VGQLQLGHSSRYRQVGGRGGERCGKGAGGCRGGTTGAMGIVGLESITVSSHKP